MMSRRRTGNFIVGGVVILMMSLLVSVSHETASALEVIWTTVNITGLLFGLDNVRDAILDDRARIKEGRNGSYKVITRGMVRAAYVSSCILLVFLYIGVAYMFLPPRDVEPTSGQLMLSHFDSFFIPTALILAAILLMWKMGAARTDRYKINEYERQREQKQKERDGE